MTPSIGRIVHYRPDAQEAKTHGPDPVPAMITAVWSNDLVNLQVNWSTAPVQCARSVARSEDGAAPGTWFWPPRPQN